MHICTHGLAEMHPQTPSTEGTHVHTHPHYACVPTHPCIRVLTNWCTRTCAHTHAPPTGTAPETRPHLAPTPAARARKALPLPASPSLTSSVHTQLQAPPYLWFHKCRSFLLGAPNQPCSLGAGGHQSHAKLPTRAGRAWSAFSHPASDTDLEQHPLPAHGHCPYTPAPAPSSVGATGQHHLQH